ncbi:ABC transporter ATP-binding protein [Phaeobacter sp. QD34_3]|uniref:ABC transporter ATP-binding protein n=1 Tax=unclassified Phaeobacter TaxID=2621772 RepID=UPI00237F52B7|nr:MULTISPECIES: ABC transporter ATP-binding protein [unclassified Phaeobacter]MDE4133665.1 ABC transporter ATP-binding protein [Phaeobacter sp. QD34_3]MDE4137402.1 ABC transporter ATP-binding protein [Phaeobacter sp. QD34_24]
MALLETHGLTARYGDFQALFGVDIALEPGETVAIIGANGAGKTTLMRSITGVLNNDAAQIRHRGVEIGHLQADTIMKRGIAMVPEGRRLFPSLTVEENLIIGGQHKGGRDLGDRIDSFLCRLLGGPDPMELAAGHDGSGYWSLDTVYDLFPILKERRHSPGTALSGGQQQMVAIGRALMSNPDILLCDEISLGLAPVVIKDIYQALPRIKENGASLIVVEQDIGQALKIADRVYCLMEGRVTLEGRPSEITRDDIHAAYFGETA